MYMCVFEAYDGFRIFVSCILNSLLMNHNETAIILYPTKALAQDQLRAITQFIQPLPPSTCCSKCQRSDSPEKCPLVTAMIIDGDTIWERRKVVCEGANLILTNPDILHYTLLPESQRFARILSNLRYIVLGNSIIPNWRRHRIDLITLRSVCAIYSLWDSFVFDHH